MKTCPPSDELRQMAAGEVAGAHYRQIESHVECCATCLRALAALTDPSDDPDWRLLGETAPQAPEFLRRLAEGAGAAETRKESPPAAAAAICFPDASGGQNGSGRLGPYRIIRELGGGSFGVVYQALDELDRPVALKVLRPERASPEDRARFEREARAAAAVKHDNVITVHQVGQTPGFPLPYLVMEYVEGETLSERLHRRGLLEPAEAARVAREVALGLGAAHARGLVHRDIKPANVLLDRATGRSRIADFGLARAVESAGACGTRTGQVMGTPAYMSPEQILHPTQIDGRADVYSLGVVLYELLTGERPFGGVPEMVVHQAVHDEPRPPRSLNGRVPRDLEVITLKCLAKEPGRRYPSANALAADLGHWLAGEPIRARPAGVGGRLLRWCRRSPALAASLGLAAAALLAVTVVSVFFALSQQARRQELTEVNQRLAELGERRRQALHLATLLAQEDSLSVCRKATDEGHDEDGKRGLLLLTETLRLATQAEDPAVERAVRGQLGAWYQRPGAARWGHQDGLTAVAFAPDGESVLTGDSFGIARLWDAATGRPLGPPLKHPAPVSAVAFHPTDPHVVLTGTGNADGDEEPPFGPRTVKHAARLWDPLTGKPPSETSAEQDGPIVAVAFGPEGRLLLTACNVLRGRDVLQAAGRVQVWETAGLKPHGPAIDQNFRVNAAAFTADGKRVVAAGGASESADEAADRGKARLYDLGAAGARSMVFSQRYPIHVVAFSPDGKSLLTAGGVPGMPAAGEARLWRLTPGAPARPLALPHELPVRAAAFSPDGKTVLTGDGAGGDWDDLGGRLPAQGEAHRWDVATGKPLGAPLVLGDVMRAVTFGADGRTAWVRGSAYRARPWEAAGAAGEPLEHLRPVLAVAASPDGRLVLTGSADGTARLWDAATALPVGGPLRHQEPVGAVAFSPDGSTALTGSADGTAVLWDVATRARRHTLRGHHGEVTAVAFSHDGKTAATAGADRTARLWHADTGEAIGAPARHAGRVLAVAFRPDDTLIATGSVGSHGDGEARLWDAATGEAVAPPLAHRLPVQAVAFQPRGDLLLTGSGALHDTEGADREPDQVPGAARLWKVGPPCEFVCSLFQPYFPTAHPVERPAAAPQQDGEQVTAVAFSPDGRLAATGSSEGRVQLWEIDTRRPLGPAVSAHAAVTAIAFSPDGRTIFAAAGASSPLAWSVPRPVAGEVERVRLWAEVVTGMSLDGNGVARALTDEELIARRRRLDELGGAPVPPPGERE